MRFVDLKSEEQLDIQSLHRVRSRPVAERTTLINQTRAILLERGLIFAVGRCKFESAADAVLDEQATSLSGRVQRQVAELRDERLLGITKCGNVYLRTLLIHGARAAMPTLSAWAALRKERPFDRAYGVTTA